MCGACGLTPPRSLFAPLPLLKIRSGTQDQEDLGREQASARAAHLELLLAAVPRPTRSARAEHFAPSKESPKQFARVGLFHVLAVQHQCFQCFACRPKSASAGTPFQCLPLSNAPNSAAQDLKPANVLLISAERIKLADLGVAKFMGGEADRMAKTQCGDTPYSFVLLAAVSFVVWF